MIPTRLIVLGTAILLLVAGCKDAKADTPSASAQPEAAPFGTEIHIPESLTSIPTGQRDPLGRELRAPCVTCHEAREKGELPSQPTLESPHTGLELDHGTLTCNSCHSADKTHEFDLADGTSVPGREVMKLCAQCHGLQYRSYENGSHGGMSGYWDQRRGPRSRNHCIDCHDSHAPAFGQMSPAPGPRDRFFSGDEPHE